MLVPTPFSMHTSERRTQKMSYRCSQSDYRIQAYRARNLYICNGNELECKRESVSAMRDLRLTFPPICFCNGSILFWQHVSASVTGKYYFPTDKVSVCNPFGYYGTLERTCFCLLKSTFSEHILRTLLRILKPTVRHLLRTLLRTFSKPVSRSFYKKAKFAYQHPPPPKKKNYGGEYHQYA